MNQTRKTKISPPQLGKSRLISNPPQLFLFHKFGLLKIDPRIRSPLWPSRWAGLSAAVNVWRCENRTAPLSSFYPKSQTQQLHLEERLLRTSFDNWCIINDGTTEPAIVMGVSGKPQELLEIESVLQDDIAVIRRFTGGGTVIVDQGTIFMTFICNKDAVPGLQAYPQPIMSWSSLIYNKVFQGIGDFKLRENDYVFGNHKFGGNAQSITKNRWVHHTSFLWDYKISNMGYLKLPERAPEYRQARDHLDFICRMKDYITSRSDFVERTIDALGTQFVVQSAEMEAVMSTLDSKFEPSSRLLTRLEIGQAILKPSRPKPLTSQSSL